MEILNIVLQKDVDEFLSTVSINIKKIRVPKGISQFDLSLTIGQKSSGFYTYAENCTKGKRFNLIQLFKITKAFAV